MHYSPINTYFCSTSCPRFLEYLDRQWNGEAKTTAPGAPRSLLSLSSLEETLRKVYRLFKDGKFGDAHKAVRQILHSIPLLVVETRREVDEVKELLTIARCVFLTCLTTHGR